MPLVFLSYRRRDSQIVTRRIYQRLTETYGNDAIFLDEESIPKGEDIREYIRDTLNQCSVVLAVIGVEWLK
ncbi:MAG TPA: toll/interleukin-1 receptor domain-containing protein [Nodosilinea sp.]|nr:toll/interleukin-1 receptor domain-containing protein [Nodosilinea sp.]